MNTFLKDLEITFRRDPSNFRPRINKHDSVKDKEQKVHFLLILDDWKLLLFGGGAKLVAQLYTTWS